MFSGIPPMTSIVLATAVVLALVAIVVANVKTAEKRIERRIPHRHPLADPQFRREMSVMLGPGIAPDNRIDDLQNGREIFPAMLEAIESAHRTITFETYIYWSGDIGARFSSALSERAGAGVEVKVLLDWVGCMKMDPEQIERMRASGVEVRYFRPLRWYNVGRMNNRTHRKLLVVDGRVGFTGGVGIADQWDGDAGDPEHWRDMHFRADGPVVAQFQAAFNDKWMASGTARGRRFERCLLHFAPRYVVRNYPGAAADATFRGRYHAGMGITNQAGLDSRVSNLVATHGIHFRIRTAASGTTGWQSTHLRLVVDGGPGVAPGLETAFGEMLGIDGTPISAAASFVGVAQAVLGDCRVVAL